MRSTLAVVICGLVCTAQSLAAQQVWSTPEPANNIGIQLSHILSRDEEFGALPSALIDLSGHFMMSRQVAFEADLPVAYLRAPDDVVTSGYGSRSSSQVGNPYVGLVVSSGRATHFKIGIRPGIFSSDGQAGIFGIYADFDHFEAWDVKHTALRGSVEFGQIPETGEFVTGEVGVTGIFPTGGDGDEALADYGVRVGFRGPSVTASLALTGRYRFDNGLGAFDENDVNQISFTVEGSHGRFRPVFGARTFLDSSIRDAGFHAVLTLGAVIGSQ
ncbi:MAG TPA: hypothetical protein VGM77_05790 [Gemmatimonadales bacterium]|jgi:hypothetical protein